MAKSVDASVLHKSLLFNGLVSAPVLDDISHLVRAMCGGFVLYVICYSSCVMCYLSIVICYVLRVIICHLLIATCYVLCVIMCYLLNAIRFMLFCHGLCISC